MRIVISGGTGMIGRGIAESLFARDHELVILTRHPAEKRGLAPEGARLIAWDGKKVDGWAKWIDGAGAIVNLAGERLAGPDPIRLRWTAARKQRICQSRLDAGAALSQAIEAATRKPAVFIQASGIDYYACGDQMATEDVPPGEGFLSWICTDCWEGSTASIENVGVRRVIIRTGPVLHRRDGALPPLVLQSRLFLGGPIGSGRQWFSWVHQSDVVNAIRFLIENPEARGPYNLVAPHPVTNCELVQTIGRVLHRPSFIPVPALLMRLLFGEMAITLLEGVRASSARLQALGFEFQFPDLESALRDLLLESS